MSLNGLLVLGIVDAYFNPGVDYETTRRSTWIGKRKSQQVAAMCGKLKHL
jgi:hypothetical protein